MLQSTTGGLQSHPSEPQDDDWSDGEVGRGGDKGREGRGGEGRGQGKGGERGGEGRGEGRGGEGRGDHQCVTLRPSPHPLLREV